MCIERLRKDRHLNQTEIIRVLSISQRSYSYYEIEDRNIPLNILCKFSRFHNISIDYLLNVTDEREPYLPKKGKAGL
ncbi:MAG: helix-turn-helix transcriptional regulator [Lachnospiraceae bacterium]|nr:helix-turn-helix transcriptional regulator [Lachnospiraceae bacterium]